MGVAAVGVLCGGGDSGSLPPSTNHQPPLPFAPPPPPANGERHPSPLSPLPPPPPSYPQRARARAVANGLVAAAVAVPSYLPGTPPD